MTRDPDVAELARQSRELVLRATPLLGELTAHTAKLHTLVEDMSQEDTGTKRGGTAAGNARWQEDEDARQDDDEAGK